MKEKLQTGDIVAIRWKDHFRFQGDDVKKPLTVTSWGKVFQQTEDGVAITQNEVEPNDYGVPQVMDGQFILKDEIVEIKKL